MALSAPGLNYKKPFYLFHYNKPKQPDLRKIKAIKFQAVPKLPIRMNNATKMRNKVIKAYSSREEPFVDYGALSQETSKTITEDPENVPRDTKTSQFRYKWIREIPVVSCRFTEHVMMYKKPPFTHEKPGGRCGQYRLRNMMIKEPSPEVEVPTKEQSDEVIPSILQ